MKTHADFFSISFLNIDQLSKFFTAAVSDKFVITVRADTVVRAMNDFNGKCYFRGLTAPKPFDGFSKKNCIVDYVGDPTPHANAEVSRIKGGVSAHA